MFFSRTAPGLLVTIISKINTYFLVAVAWLFTSAMVRHAFVPESFRFGIIKPILKNKYGDQTNLDMYRGITLTPAISKLFEAVLLSIYGSNLNSDPLHFSFKKDSGCNHSLFTFSESVKFYNKRGNKAYCVLFFLMPAKPLTKC